MDTKETFGNVIETPFPISLPCGASLSIEIGGITTKFSSKLIGYAVHEYLIIKTPIFGNVGLLTAKLFTGNKIIVRFVADGTVYGFEAEILGMMSAPVKLLVSSYPKVVHQYELRGEKRYECIIPGTLHKEDDKYPAAMTDVSQQGCGITVKARDSHAMPIFKIGDQVAFHFVVPGSEEKLFLSGELKNLNQDKTRTILGVTFLDITDGLKNTLNNYIMLMGDIM